MVETRCIIIGNELKKLLSFETAREIDNISQKHYAIPDIILMEQAGQHLARVLEPQLKQSSVLCAVCGSGNNGGDAQVLARELFNKGYTVFLGFIREPRSRLAQIQLKMLQNLNCPVLPLQELQQKIATLTEQDWIIDGISGIGITRPLSYQEFIREMNRSKARILSVDLPSGIHESMNIKESVPVVKADITVSFGAEKKAMYFPHFRDYCGKTVIVNPGFPQQLLEEARAAAWLVEEDDLQHVPRVSNYIYKHRKGVLAVAAGSRSTPGAAYLVLQSASQSFAGMIYALLDAELELPLATRTPSVIVGKKLEDIKCLHALVIGPGWGMSRSPAIFQKLLDRNTLCVIDADGLYYLKKHYASLNSTQIALPKTPSFVLTPHVGELRMLRPSFTDNYNLWASASEVSEQYNAIVVAKNTTTAVLYKDAPPFIIDGSNPALANAGSGDILSGLLGSYLAYYLSQNESSRESRAPAALQLHTAIAVLLHALAARGFSRYFVSAEDIANAVGNLGALLK